jgi:hypothetical protein
MRGIAACLLLCLAVSAPAQLDTAALSERSAFDQRCQPPAADPGAGFVEYAGRRVRKLQNEAGQQYSVARTDAAQRAQAVKAGEARLQGEIQKCRNSHAAR